MSEPATPQAALAELITCLRRAELDWDAENIAELVWLSRYMEGETTQQSPSTPGQSSSSPLRRQTDPTGAAPLPPPPPSPEVGLYSDEPQTLSTQETPDRGGIPFQVPTPPALRKTLAIGRALRPLMRKVDSYKQQVLDEEATAEQTAEQQFCMTVVRPAKERWLEVALVIEDSAASFLWRETIRDFKQVLERQGAFRSITVWHLQTSQGDIKLFAKPPSQEKPQPSRSAKELIDASGRRLILLVSDCISSAWRSQKFHQEYLERWAAHSPVAIVQLLPGHLWSRTVLSSGLEVQLGAWIPGVTNQQLLFQEPPIGAEQGQSEGLKLPVITLEPNSLIQWAKMVSGWGESWTAGIWFDEGWQSQSPLVTSETSLSAEQLVKRFTTTASQLAKRLAGLMALVPINLPIIYLLQETMLRESTPLHLAEIFMSGLIERGNEGAVTADGVRDGEPAYDFVAGVREPLMDSVPTPLKEAVLDQVSQYIGKKLNRSIYSFTALLQLEEELGGTAGSDLLKFAHVAKQVLQRMGGDYAALVDALEHPVGSGSSVALPEFELPPLRTIPFTRAELIDAEDAIAPEAGWPPLQTDTFQVATVTFEREPDDALVPFEFVVATIARQESKWIIQRQQRTAYMFIELLTVAADSPVFSGVANQLGFQNYENSYDLEMVAIPGGSFEMGSPTIELKRDHNEGLQHQVQIKPFFMGRYPITQAQWHFVAGLAQVNRELTLDPCSFKGNNLPIEKVNWYEAVEFCDRISRHTGRDYRLPTEAEWEYACRAGTNTPFHFGETITPELANYRGTETYANGPKGEYRRETTPVDYFGVANAFGISDMHGNVFEWCLDYWHASYENAPTDGSVWLDNESAVLAEGQVYLNMTYGASDRVRRGGSWLNAPNACRSAYRLNHEPDSRRENIGFRVVCSPKIASN